LLLALQRAILALVLLGLTACATPTVPLAALQSQWPADLPTRAQINNLAFIAQEDYQCGPAALAMVAAHAGVQRDMATWVQQVYVPGRQGAFQIELLAASRRNGLPGFVIAPQIEIVLREVAAGHPVLVLQNLAFAWRPVWHFAVVTGYDKEQGNVTLHSGRTENMQMSLITFERTWARADRWAMLALPPAQLPAQLTYQTPLHPADQPADTSSIDGYVAAIVALERENPGAAQTAYATVLKTWHGHPIALLGAGNTAYALGQRDAAQAAYRAAVQVDPRNGDAWNNLAQVLLDQGQREQALQAAQRAVATAGPRLAAYQALLHEIMLFSSQK
jgi:tetratricopeptide (TPR) repeat protein